MQYIMHLDAEKAEFGRMVGAQKHATQCASALHVVHTPHTVTCVETKEVFALHLTRLGAVMFLQLLSFEAVQTE